MADPFGDPPEPPAAPPPAAREGRQDPLRATPRRADPFEEPLADPFGEPTAPAPAPVQVPVQAPMQAPAGPARAGDAALAAAFLRGLGLEGELADPAATLQLAGAALRAAVSGLRQAMIARASVKGEFRIEQTMIQARGNNPLKFSAGDDDALAALLGVGRRAGMPADRAMEEALRDLRLHELATVTAMQAAVRALMERFDPAGIERAAEKGGGFALPGARKGRAWDAFAALHAEVSGALADDFDSVFGKSFARAYERAMDELSEGDGS